MASNNVQTPDALRNVKSGFTGKDTGEIASGARSYSNTSRIHIQSAQDLAHELIQLKAEMKMMANNQSSEYAALRKKIHAKAEGMKSSLSLAKRDCLITAKTLVLLEKKNVTLSEFAELFDIDIVAFVQRVKQTDKNLFRQLPESVKNMREQGTKRSRQQAFAAGGAARRVSVEGDTEHQGRVNRPPSRPLPPPAGHAAKKSEAERFDDDDDDNDMEVPDDDDGGGFASPMEEDNVGGYTPLMEESDATSSAKVDSINSEKDEEVVTNPSPKTLPFWKDAPSHFRYVVGGEKSLCDIKPKAKAVPQSSGRELPGGPVPGGPEHFRYLEDE